MAPRPCQLCASARAVLKRPKTGQSVCKQCFFAVFETEVHETILAAHGRRGLFQRGERVAIGASGGKDSTVLAHVLTTLNRRYDYGLQLYLLSIDEGITGYRDDSLETVKRNQQQYALPLTVLGYRDLYGWTMDDIVSSVGRKNNCTFCGVFRRQALDRGAASLGVDHIVTGHNADDIAETILLNVLRGDISRLARCTEITTKGTTDGPDGEEVAGSGIKRSKPFKYAYEKEIVMYAYFKKLDYFSTECIYSPNAYRGYARTYLKDLEALRPSAIIDLIYSGEQLAVRAETRVAQQQTCVRCGYMSSNPLCKACVLLEGLNRGIPALGVRGDHSSTRRLRDAHAAAGASGDDPGRTIPRFERLRLRDTPSPPSHDPRAPFAHRTAPPDPDPDPGPAPAPAPATAPGRGRGPVVTQTGNTPLAKARAAAQAF